MTRIICGFACAGLLALSLAGCNRESTPPVSMQKPDIISPAPALPRDPAMPAVPGPNPMQSPLPKVGSK